MCQRIMGKKNAAQLLDEEFLIMSGDLKSFVLFHKFLNPPLDHVTRHLCERGVVFKSVRGQRSRLSDLLRSALSVVFKAIL